MVPSSFEDCVSQIAAGQAALPSLAAHCEALAGSGRGDLAELAYRVWIRLNPERPEAFAAHFNRGVLLERGGDLAGAESAYRAAIAGKPDFLPASLRLASLLARARRSDAALFVALDALTGLCGQSSHELQARMREEVGRTASDAALPHFLKALDALGRAADALRAPGLAGDLGPQTPAPPIHPLLQMRDLYDEASARLCEPMTPETLKEIRRALAAARSIPEPEGLSEEARGWFKHYALACAAIDPAVLSAEPAPAPAAAPSVRTTWASASGEEISLEAVAAKARRLRAKAVFFVAADRAYIDLYARAYASSVLKHLDVPALVVIHVIGGAGELLDVARGVGVEDRRLVYAGDGFEAAAATAAVFDTPPKGRLARPAAHLQSIRFQRLGALLAAFDLPVFTSDIDLVLQRGVLDLLERCAGADLVVNENRGNANAGSRFTANLSLVYPTVGGKRFAERLKAYLDDHLSREEVSRWIDQFGLLMSLQALRLERPELEVRYFDTDSDINNVMFQRFEPNPYRFLSLYHGFDMTSLETGPIPAASRAA